MNIILSAPYHILNSLFVTFVFAFRFFYDLNIDRRLAFSPDQLNQIRKENKQQTTLIQSINQAVNHAKIQYQSIMQKSNINQLCKNSISINQLKDQSILQ